MAGVPRTSKSFSDPLFCEVTQRKVSAESNDKEKHTEEFHLLPLSSGLNLAKNFFPGAGGAQTIKPELPLTPFPFFPGARGASKW